ncbi:hypothetical protein HMPREF9946_00451 [Acetobacteraceae bacterium AT-5844]|nr:hypothetical protein HMPREF9946_00451 [Acetobacteraceae bacterium AT-5844]
MGMTVPAGHTHQRGPEPGIRAPNAPDAAAWQVFRPVSGAFDGVFRAGY